MSAALDVPAVTGPVTGYVEAMTATAAMGWAWQPGSAAPLQVELLLGADVLAQGAADVLREDLQRNGIGDGRHAFTLPVPEAVRGRLGELRVVARTPGGAGVPLNAPPPADGMSERLAHLARGMEAVMASQRLLHRNVQAVLLAAPAANMDAQAAVAATQAQLAEGIATVELFVVRLEAALAGMGQAPAPAAPRWALPAVAAMAAMALAASLMALVRAMPG